MKLEPDKKVKIQVTHCECDFMKKGDTLYLNGPMIDKERSDSICVTALTGIYPWVVTARFGIESEKLEYTGDSYRVWCPERLVEFTIQPEEG
ncbi:MAG: TIGR04076 family protein [Desulfobacterales bacterium]|nr:TIGR04076 family protein [Desulfobacterales bacterium]